VFDAIDAHLTTFVSGDPDDPLFPGEAGGIINGGWFQREWRAARAALGLDEVHFHDLRHAFATIATQQGATMREVMARRGHSTTSAAIRCRSRPRPSTCRGGGTGCARLTGGPERTAPVGRGHSDGAVRASTAGPAPTLRFIHDRAEVVIEVGDDPGYRDDAYFVRRDGRWLEAVSGSAPPHRWWDRTYLDWT
jgi:hypothetical protein